MGSVSIEDGGLEHMSSQVSGELVRTRTRVPGKGKVLTYALDQGVLASRCLEPMVLENIHKDLTWSLLRCYLLCWKSPKKSLTP